MNYIGSKLSLLGFLKESIESVAGKQQTTFCDMFAGTGAVGAHFKRLGYTVTANDLQYYSYVLNKHYVENVEMFGFGGLTADIPLLAHTDIADKPNVVCEYLTRLKPREGFIYNNYAAGSGSGRLYFSDENAMRCDAIRMQIEEWRITQKIAENEYYFLLTSLLETIDKHANTASVYAAFLKKLKKTAQKDFVLSPAQILTGGQEHKACNCEANRFISEVGADIVYLDPPYNQRQYASNYHLLETIARYDSPEIHGKTGLRNYTDQKSYYCSTQTVLGAFTDIIVNVRAKYIFLSYNNEGLLSHDDIRAVMSRRGEYGFFTQDCNRFKADNGRAYSASKTTEYLHWCKTYDTEYQHWRKASA
ncbi:restriction endonuclease subunit M [Campylobacterota bacterium]|nr:restriction endonuclease subunit M [Campylobacterota bacterium]